MATAENSRGGVGYQPACGIRGEVITVESGRHSFDRGNYGIGVINPAFNAIIYGVIHLCMERGAVFIIGGMETSRMAAAANHRVNADSRDEELFVSVSMRAGGTVAVFAADVFQKRRGGAVRKSGLLAVANADIGQRARLSALIRNQAKCTGVCRPGPRAIMIVMAAAATARTRVIIGLIQPETVVVGQIGQWHGRRPCIT